MKVLSQSTSPNVNYIILPLLDLTAFNTQKLMAFVNLES
jgi:hypothetical protein